MLHGNRKRSANQRLEMQAFISYWMHNPMDDKEQFMPAVQRRHERKHEETQEQKIKRQGRVFKPEQWNQSIAIVS